MAHDTATVIVDRPIGEVFAFLADGMNEPAWRPGVTDVSHVAETGTEVGATFKQTMKGPGGRSIPGDYRITRYDQPTRLRLRSDRGTGPPDRPIRSARDRRRHGGDLHPRCQAARADGSHDVDDQQASAHRGRQHRQSAESDELRTAALARRLPSPAPACPAGRGPPNSRRSLGATVRSADRRAGHP